VTKHKTLNGEALQENKKGQRSSLGVLAKPPPMLRSVREWEGKRLNTQSIGLGEEVEHP
jgi:hypothetical protein